MVKNSRNIFMQMSVYEWEMRGDKNGAVKFSTNFYSFVHRFGIDCVAF